MIKTFSLLGLLVTLDTSLFKVSATRDSVAIEPIDGIKTMKVKNGGDAIEGVPDEDREFASHLAQEHGSTRRGGRGRKLDPSSLSGRIRAALKELLVVGEPIYYNDLVDRISAQLGEERQRVLNNLQPLAAKLGIKRDGGGYWTLPIPEEGINTGT